MKLFTEHPHSVGETYGEHLVNANKFGVKMVLGGTACIIHSFLPFLFANTARRTVGQLSTQLITHRDSMKNVNADKSMPDAETATGMHI